MFLHIFTKWFLRLLFVSSISSALGYTELTYHIDDNEIEITGCLISCPSILSIPEKINEVIVTKISSQAFEDNQISEVTFPHSLKIIGPRAFYGNNITTIKIPSSVEEIDDQAFFLNPLQKVSFLGNRPQIGDDVFALNAAFDESKAGMHIFCVPLIGPCSYVFTDNLGNTVSYLPTTATSNLLITYCDDKSHWPGEAIYTKSETSIIDGMTCTTGIPSSCNGGELVEYYSTPIIGSSCNLTSTLTPLALDIDQNGRFDALTDGLIILRYGFNLRGDNLTTGAVASDATRTSAEDIEEHIQSLLP